MTRWEKGFILIVLGVACLASLPGSLVASDSSLKKQSTWNWPESQSVITRFEDFLGTIANRSNTPTIKNRLSELTSLRGVALLENVVAIAAECDPSVAKIRELLSGEVSSQTAPSIDAALSSMMANGGIPNWLKSDVQLYVCRVLVQNALYDEAIQQLKLIDVDQVSDPSTYLFYKAICQHHLLSREECLENLSKLLEREMELPTRYAITARLMEADIRPLKEDSLDEISRLMNDVERRLTLGRAGKLVRDKQQTIVDKLDKSIEQLEQQIQQMQQQRQKQQQQQRKPAGGSSNPLEESQIADVKGAGEVDNKDIGKSSGWGNLPPAQRKEAIQDMTKDLPSHYRDVVEAYFKKLSKVPSDR
jgi:chaperonin cofactor prefoldin